MCKTHKRLGHSGSSCFLFSLSKTCVKMFWSRYLCKGILSRISSSSSLRHPIFQRVCSNYNSYQENIVNKNYETKRQGRYFEDERYSGKMRSTLGDLLPTLVWDSIELTKVNKKNYESSNQNSERSEEEIQEFRDKNKIVIVKGNVPRPTLSFQEVGFPDEINRSLNKLGYVEPMAIQAQGWPIALSGKDMIGIGETGSGKTLGFLIPAIVHILNQERTTNSRKEICHSPIALILAPTRELATQINNVVRQLRLVTSACLVGGLHKSTQLRDLNRGAELVVATPGRLIDLLEDGYTHLQKTSYVVLDEADRMLDMGFEPQIRKILSQVRPDKQLLLWSATWPEDVQDLASDYVSKDYIHLLIGSSHLQANKNISQSVILCTQNLEKDQKMLEYFESLDEESLSKILIFADTKARVDVLVQRLNRLGYNARGIHGDKSQNNRTATLDLFRHGKINVLVATNVAARGLDVDDIKVVVNYDHPSDSADYVHRIGRTGRQGRSGKSLSLLCEDTDAAFASSLVDILRQTEQNVPTELLALASDYSTSQRKKPSKKYGRTTSPYIRRKI